MKWINYRYNYKDNIKVINKYLLLLIIIEYRQILTIVKSYLTILIRIDHKYSYIKIHNYQNKLKKRK